MLTIFIYFTPPAIFPKYILDIIYVSDRNITAILKLFYSRVTKINCSAALHFSAVLSMIEL